MPWRSTRTSSNPASVNAVLSRSGVLNGLESSPSWLPPKEIKTSLCQAIADAGLHDVQVRAFTPLDRDPLGFYATQCEPRADNALQLGAIDADEHRRWLDELAAEQTAGRFLAGQLHIFAWATKPHA